MNILDQIKETVAFLQSKTSISPEVGIVLGSGLKSIAADIKNRQEIPYSEIPNFAQTTVKGHSGKLIFGELSGKKVVAMSGRFHYYEGYTMHQVVFPIRVMKFLGCESVIISNASGGMNPNMEIGDIMVINDHINMSINPLIGPNEDELGPRFPDMLDIYEPNWVTKAVEIGKSKGFRISQGVYVGVTGPTFETPAEYKAYHLMGGDAIGMSTVPEVIAARHCGLKIFGVSVVSDIGYPPERMVTISHEDVIKAANEAGKRVTEIVKELLLDF